MPFVSNRDKLEIPVEDMDHLVQCSRSRSEGAARVHRAKVLLAYHAGDSISKIAREMRTNRPKVERTIQRALDYGIRSALQDLPRRGRSSQISAEARAWLVSVACTKPKDLGYAAEIWTTRTLSGHIRKHCLNSGHPSLCRLSRGTVSKILARSEVKPHKIQYYWERRGPEFDLKMAQVLLTYKEVEMLRTSGLSDEEASYVAVLSYDGKPGIQAIQNMPRSFRLSLGSILPSEGTMNISGMVSFPFWLPSVSFLAISMGMSKTDIEVRSSLSFLRSSITSMLLVLRSESFWITILLTFSKKQKDTLLQSQIASTSFLLRPMVLGSTSSKRFSVKPPGRS
jgi:transposase